MAVITNGDLVNNLTKELRLQSGAGKIPNQISDTVVPVYQLSKKTTYSYFSSSSSSQAAATIVTLPNSDKDFYLTHICVSLASSSTCDDVSAYVYFQIADGGNFVPIHIVKNTLTLYNDNQVITFSNPIKIKAGSAVKWDHQFTVGGSTFTTNFSGYFE